MSGDTDTSADVIYTDLQSSKLSAIKVAADCSGIGGIAV